MSMKGIKFMPEDSPKKDSSYLFYGIASLLLLIIGAFVYLILDESARRERLGPPPLPKTTQELQKEVLGMIGKPDSKNLKRILVGTNSKDHKERLYSLRALQYYGASQAHHMLPFLKDPDQNIRNAAMQILGNMRYLPATAPLLQNLMQDKKTAAQIIGIQAMGKICQRRFSLPQVRPVVEYLIDVMALPGSGALFRYAHQALVSITGHPAKMEGTSKKDMVDYWKSWVEENSHGRRKHK